MKSIVVEVEAWQTSDGQVFYDEFEAKHHEDKLEFYQYCFDNFNLNENGVKDFVNTYKRIVLGLIED